MFDEPAKFEIQFDSPSKAYYAGTHVSGSILLTLDKPTTARGVKLTFSGIAKVRWRRSAGIANNVPNSKIISAEEEYMRYSFYVLGSPEAKIEIPSGDYVYPFTASLPSNLPSSFRSEYGQVQYTATAKVKRSWTLDYETVSTFTVVTPIDLNFLASAAVPVLKIESKMFSHWLLKSGPLSLSVHVPFTGIVCGQTLEATIKISNDSDVNVESVDCKLTQEVKCIARSKTRTVSLDIAEVKGDGLEPSNSRTQTMAIVVPETPFVNLTGCNIIAVKHSLKVIARVGMTHKNLTVEIPLILGTIPINSSA